MSEAARERDRRQGEERRAPEGASQFSKRNLGSDRRCRMSERRRGARELDREGAEEARVDLTDLPAVAEAVLDLVESEGRDTGLNDALSDLRDALDYNRHHQAKAKPPALLQDLIQALKDARHTP